MKGWSRFGYCAGLLALLCGWNGPALAADATEAPAEVDLLRLHAAHVEQSTAAVDELAALAALNDGDPSSVARARARPAAPLDVVFGFGGAEVTAERLVVQLPDGSSTGRVEILASTLSAQAGFRSLRADRLNGSSGPQEFRFQPAGARWIMLRFTPAEGRNGVDVAEVGVFGHEGAPATRYAFKQAPAAAIDVLARLKSLSPGETSLGEDERALFADAADGKLHQWSLEDAALIASGVGTAQARAPYLTMLNAIEAEAARAVGSGGTPFERGQRLLQWLYRGGMLKHYSLNQTDLSTLLENGSYNCVSSAVLYTIIGGRLGLDVRAVEVPDHAFAVLYDGTRHADVETTVAGGFNPDRDALSLFQRLTGFVRPPDDKRELRREVSGIGLIASIYYNHGVLDGEAGHQAQALGQYFRALSLDPDQAIAVQNTLATLSNWSAELIHASHYPEAVQELEVGLALAPDDAGLNNNYLVAWQHWANAEIQAGHRDAALAVLRKAAQAAPRGNFDAMQTWVYISPAQDLAKRERWDEAIAIVDAARPQFRDQQLSDLENFEAGLYNQQALALAQRKRWAEAQALFAAAEARLPRIDVLRHNEIYVWTSWCIDDDRNGDIAGMLDVAQKAHQRFPDEAELAENERIAWQKSLRAPADKGNYEAAVRAAQQAEERLPGDAAIRQEELADWVNWSKALLDDRKWAQGIEVCQRGLQRFANDEKLRGNEQFAWFGLGKEQVEAGQWQEAVDTYAHGRARFPDVDGLKNNELAAWSNWSLTRYKAGDWSGSIEVARQGLQRFPGDAGLRDLELNDWLGMSGARFDAAQWPQAIEALENGLKDFPDNKPLQENLYAAWSNWARAGSEHGDWKAALDTLALARQRFPDDKRLADFELYCWTSWVKAQADKSDWTGAMATVQAGLKRFPAEDRLLNARSYCEAHMGKT